MGVILVARVCVFVCVYALRIVPMDKSLRFINTLIIIKRKACRVRPCCLFFLLFFVLDH